MSESPVAWSRRHFLQSLAVAGSWAAFAPASAQIADRSPPWFQRTLRWGQTNLTEVDPARIEIAFWREQWRRTAIQGVVINAGGIVAYYPTNVPGHRRARDLGERDLFGELTAAAHADGLAVFARMDSNRADETFYRAHPDWFAHDAQGEPYRVTGLYVACVNSPYYNEYIPSILREIVTRYHPEGVTDNNWNGPMRHQPCFCARCAEQFRARTGHVLPQGADWNSPVYREWIMWNYARRLEIWDLFNRTTREAGGPACLWVGMMAGSQNWQSRVFRDDREIYRRTELIMLDHQRRFDEEGFPHNAETGKRLHAVGGWDKVIPESIAMYHLTEHNYRLATKPVPEVRLWTAEALAGGIQPWWHHVGAVQEDRRMLETAAPLWRWHRDHEAYLVNRRPLAPIGLLWSQRNMDFFGRDHGSAHVDEPWNGWTQALVRARLPYVPVHVDDLDRLARELDLRVIILPNLGGLSDGQLEFIRRFFENGGSVVATGLTSVFDEWGVARNDFGLADVFGCSLPADHPWRNESTRDAWATDWVQTYVRLPAERAAPARHPLLAPFVGTDIVAFGGRLSTLDLAPSAQAIATYVPPVPVSPAEAIWMPEPTTSIPALIAREHGSGSRVVYLPADIDRQFARENLPDHGNLLAEMVRWCARDFIPFEVQGPGLVDCHLYQQDGRRILHLVNLTNSGTWRTPVHELIALGPYKVILPTSGATKAQALVDGTELAVTSVGDRLQITVPVIRDHEVIVIQ